MNKHPDCEDRCQILEHKGYHTCSQTGRCEQLEAMTAPQETPRTDALTTAHYHSACADAAGMGTEIPCEEAYGEVVTLAKTLERELASAQGRVRELERPGYVWVPRNAALNAIKQQMGKCCDNCNCQAMRAIQDLLAAGRGEG